MTMLGEVFGVDFRVDVETRASRLVRQAISMFYADDREPRYERDGELVAWTDIGGEG